ncbi:maleylpyruvate isomerase family mycothiol-dependent enzyme [Nocardioides sp. KC13]|uniref:Maleylpyruvate isomerase family mycothiol-dependent enzyme n=1 Tax=Nocardioides turkmenicus TaxID=2711220 RepID=A0A6M1R4T5_9ACTN|nr:maleylpyruvate isomerase family mycothiol-dependent enzyme [Nocardioides sp. KC13]NGN95274.1 maleylpyruvate isomerase family mycothiol-dependent enzyme [Nocardioides sp. KC13]
MRVDRTSLATAERRDLADFLETLTPEQWDQPSLCRGWSVRDVVAHMISYEEVGLLGFFGRFARQGFRFGRMNQSRLEEFGTRSPEELVAYVRAHAKPSGPTAVADARIGLTDGLIHHQDIRRALGKPRQVPAERLLPVLGFAMFAPPLPAKQNAQALRLVATDLDWSRGSGEEVTGPGEALLMAVCGRADALPELSGPGLATLESRVRR